MSTEKQQQENTIKRADLIGSVVWGFVRDEADKTSGRSIHLIAGFRPEHLVGISRMMPADMQKTTILKIRTDIDSELSEQLPDDHLTDMPAVHFRNSDEAQIILFAVSDSEREAVGASLNPVSRIDRNSLQKLSHLWLDEILKVSAESAGGQERRTWLEAALQGLDRSHVTKELDQFAEFVRVLRDLRDEPWDQRIRLALPSFRIPINSTGKVPAIGSSKSASASAFQQLFNTAYRETSGFPHLMDISNRPIEPALMLERLDSYGAGQTKAEKLALSAIRSLLDDANKLRPGDWRNSQERFCQQVDWKRFGKVIFDAKKPRRSPDLSERTKEFIQDEYQSEADVSDNQFLDELKDKATSSEQDHEFFERWQEKILSSKNQKLYESWRRYLFSEEVSESDLQIAILRGVQTLLMKVSEQDSGATSGVTSIRLSARNGDRLSTWTELDSRIYKLFRLEGQLLGSLLKPYIKFEFGQWLAPKAIEQAKPQKKKDARQIEFEMSLIDDAGEELASSRVRIFWRPGHSGISLAWPEDIEGLYQGISDSIIRVHKQTFSLKPGGATGSLPANLKDTGSFVDVSDRENGRTASPAILAPGNDVFSSILDGLAEQTRSHSIGTEQANSVRSALLKFRHTFGSAIEKLHKDPSQAYVEDIIERQASDFGKLCRQARVILAGSLSTRTSVMKDICEFGIVVSNSGSEAAIIPAWHPLRLLERKAKATELSEFLKVILTSEDISSDGLERACADRQSSYENWFYPEVISISLGTYAAIEHLGGYSLAVSVDEPHIDAYDLEKTTSVAVREYASVADRYLQLNPHEEGNFSTAIFNAETISLPGQIARALEARMTKQKFLRCSLLICHDDPERMRIIYAEQNARLRSQSVDDVTEGFLSRLRVGVGKGDTNHEGRDRSSIDIVLLHHSFFRHSEATWAFQPGSSKTLSDKVDFRNAAMPRRKNDSKESIELALSATRPPRACAEFLDLCFTAHKDARHIPENCRSLPVRRLTCDSDTVRRTIERAHELGEWVVTVDSMISREMLAANGIKVIRDVALTDSDLRVLVSSREPSESLKRHLIQDFKSMEDSNIHSVADQTSKFVINRVVEVCGQKILSSARSKIAAREIIGLAAATAIVELLEMSEQAKPVWFSLDDNRAFFGLKGKMADTLAISISRSSDGTFSIKMIIVEAKCISITSELVEAKSSREQTSSTLGTLQANFSQQKDPIAREAWGLSLLSLLSLRPEHVQFFKNKEELENFQGALASGNVSYQIEGKSVVVVHDDVSPTDEIVAAVSPSDNDVLQYRIGQRALGSLLSYVQNPKAKDSSSISILSEGGSTNQRQVIERQNENLPIVTDQEIGAAERGEISYSVSDTVVSEDLQNDNSSTIAILTTPFDELESVRTGQPNNPGLPPLLANAMKLSAKRNASGAAKKKIEDEAKHIAGLLQGALVEFNMNARLLSPPTIITPNGVLVNFAGHKTLTVKKLRPILTELLTTFGLNVTDIRTGSGRISLFVASENRQVVDLAQVWLDADWPSSAPHSLQNFLIGLREDNGEPLWLNLQGSHGGGEQHAPHTLIAGETGSGKGVLTQNLLLQMIAFNSPATLKLYVIDPKHGVDFAWINKAPHLARKIVTNQEDSKEVLEELVAEMERRYELFQNTGATKISEYNSKVPSAEQLPLCVVVHDEMADWMASSDEYKKVVQQCFTRLAAKARAAGIHVIMITQRAANDAIPVGIRDNLGNRLCLKVAGEAGSNLALGMPGAERLLGRGHVAARVGGDKPPGEDYYVVQVPFANSTDLEIFAEIVTAISL